MVAKARVFLLVQQRKTASRCLLLLFFFLIFFTKTRNYRNAGKVSLLQFVQHSYNINVPSTVVLNFAAVSLAGLHLMFIAPKKVSCSS